jgi:hypothetical protein
MRYITLGNTLYAVGLLWQTHKGPGGRKILLRLSRDIAKEFGAEKYNCVALRTQQYGIGQSELPLPRAYPLASSLSLPRQDNFIGVFHFGEFWWVCGISRGIIAADGDVPCSSRAEAEAAAKDVRSIFGDGEIVYFDTPEESATYLLPLLLKPEKRLEPLIIGDVQKKALQKRLGLVAMVACVLLGGWWAITTYLDQEAASQMRTLVQSKEQVLADLKAHPERHFSMGWQTAPVAVDAGLQCMKAMLAEPLAVQGWSLEEIICVPGSSVTVSRVHHAGADYTNLPPAMRIISPKNARSSAPLPALSKSPPLAHTDLLSRDLATAVMYQVTQSLRANLENLAWDQPDKLEENGQVLAVAPWVKAKFMISALPHEYVGSGKLFAILGLPGLSVSGIDYLHNSNAWKIQGVIYAKTAATQ